MTDGFTDYDRLLDLLSQRALEGIDADGERELSTLLERFPDVDENQLVAPIETLLELDGVHFLDDHAIGSSRF